MNRLQMVLFYLLLKVNTFLKLNARQTPLGGYKAGRMRHVEVIIDLITMQVIRTQEMNSLTAPLEYYWKYAGPNSPFGPFPTIMHCMQDYAGVLRATTTELQPSQFDRTNVVSVDFVRRARI